MPEPMIHVGAFRCGRPRALTSVQWDNYHRALAELLGHVSGCRYCRGDRTRAGSVRQPCARGCELWRVVELRAKPEPKGILRVFG